MNSSLNFAIVLFAAALLALKASAAEPLTWKFEAGQQLRYEVRHHNAMKIVAERAGEFDSQTDQSVVLHWDVDTVDDRVATVDQTVESLEVKIAMPGGMELVFDSRTGKPAEGIAAMLSPMFDALIQTPVRLQITSRGEITGLKADEAALEKLRTLPAIKSLGEMVSTEGLRHLSEAVAFELPEGDLTPGSKVKHPLEVENRILGKLSGRAVWTYTGTDSRDGKEYDRFEPAVDLEITPVEPVAGDKPASGPKPLANSQLTDVHASGEALFDRESGTLHSSSLQIKFILTGTLSGNATSCEMVQNTEVTRR